MSSVCGIPSVNSSMAFKKRRLNRLSSGRRFPLNDFPEPFLSEHFSAQVFRVRQPIGMNHQNVALCRDGAPDVNKRRPGKYPAPARRPSALQSFPWKSGTARPDYAPR